MLEHGCLRYVAAKLPSLQRSKVSNSKMGALKVLIFWAIDGPEFRGIKESDFKVKREEGRQTKDKERRIERDW